MSENEANSLPPGWALTTLGTVAQINPRQWDVPPTDEDFVSFVPMPDVEARTGKMQASHQRLWHEVKKGYTPFQEGDLLFAKITPCMENGKCAIAKGLVNGRGAGSTEFHVLRPTGAIHPTLLLHFLLRQSYRRDARMSMKGAAGQLRVPESFLTATSLGLPPISEQCRIVAEIEKQFSRLDAAVTALKRVQANLKRYRAAVLRAACEGRLVPNEAELARQEGRDYEPADALLQRILCERRARWEAEQMAKLEVQGRLPLNDTWKVNYNEPPAPDTASLPELPEGWCWATLISIADIKGGITKGQKRRPNEILRNVPYLRVANVQRGHIDLTEIKYIEATEEEISQLCLQSGDVLFNEGGDRDKLGRGWIWNGQLHKCIHQNHVFRARLFLTCMQPKYISWYGNTIGVRYFVEQGKQTTNLASINMTKLGGLPIPLPPLAEQERIVGEVERRLSIVEEVEATVAANLKRAERLRQAILQRAFSGKLVPQDPNDEPASVLLERIQAERNNLPIARKDPTIPQKTTQMALKL